tara:strand:+ start:342 stop:1043 length:702 start_codon:yes stop_codon:yes gene_type:complete
MPRKKNKKIYFGMDVQEAIVKYNDSDDYNFRNNIYKNEIHAAFDKLAENIINTFKFTYFDVPFEDVKHEVVAFLVMNMHKYDHTKGSKAFSYFSVVAKNYLILHNNNNYKKYKKHKSIDLVDVDTRLHYPEQDVYLTTFIIEMIQYFNDNIPMMFKRDKEIKIAYAILEILKKRNDIENFNKKFIYVLIREMTDSNTADITKVVNVFKKYYKKLLNKFDTVGSLQTKTPVMFF